MYITTVEMLYVHACICVYIRSIVKEREGRMHGGDRGEGTMKLTNTPCNSICMFLFVTSTRTVKDSCCDVRT